jgi:DNA polymerase-1
MASGDKNLGEALMGGDMHAKTAAYMFRKPEDIVTKADRHAAKRVSFGTAYWRSAYTLALGPLQDVLGGMDVPESRRIGMAQKFIDDFRALYSDYYAWQLESANTAVTTGELSTVFGRKRRWQLITNENREEIRRQGVNYPIQSTASDMCSSALVRLADVLPKRKLGYPLYTVHDEVVCEIRQDRIEEGIGAITEVMSNPVIDTNGAEFPVDSGYGLNLGDLEPWKPEGK